MNILTKLINYIFDYPLDPLRDPRCKGCVHADGLICPYPNECSTMLKIKENEKKSI